MDAFLALSLRIEAPPFFATESAFLAVVFGFNLLGDPFAQQRFVSNTHGDLPVRVSIGDQQSFLDEPINKALCAGSRVVISRPQS
jgi:hypothetical protein